MLGHRRQYRILLVAIVFALITGTFFAAYQGAHHWDSIEARALTLHIKGGHPRHSRGNRGRPGRVLHTRAVDSDRRSVFHNRMDGQIGRPIQQPALRVSTQNVNTLIATERPYLTGGGGFFRVASSGPRIFRVDVANYGKTPALLTHYDVQFTTKVRVKALPLLEVDEKNFKHFDWIAPNSGKSLRDIPIPDNIDVIYGSFWYRDFNAPVINFDSSYRWIR